jgi:predicted dehydrogenase
MPRPSVAVIGAGRMGRRHMEVARQLGLELVAICDRSTDVLDAAGAEFGILAAHRHAEGEELLAASAPECVVIATTAETHADLVCRAAAAGARFIFCEKPMAVSLAECDAMIDACASSGTRLAVNHQMRFMEQYTEPKKWLAGAELGGLTSVSVVAGNFGVAMNGTHYFEMFRFMSDEYPLEATAWFDDQRVPNPRGPQFEDRAGTVRLRTASGKRFYMDASADQGHGLRVVYAARYGQVDVDELAGTAIVTAREAGHRALPTTRYAMPAHDDVRKIAPVDVIGPTKAVLQALLTGDSWPSGEDGRAAVAALVAAHVSHEGGNVPVAIDPARLPRDRRFAWA